MKWLAALALGILLAGCDPWPEVDNGPVMIPVGATALILPDLGAVESPSGGFLGCEPGDGSLVCVRRDFKLTRMISCPPEYVVGLTMAIPRDQGRSSKALQAGAIAIVLSELGGDLKTEQYLPGYHEQVAISLQVGSTVVPVMTLGGEVSGESKIFELNNGAAPGTKSALLDAFQQHGEATLRFAVSATCVGLGEGQYSSLAQAVGAKVLLRAGAVLLQAGKR